jgi:hypothetical protein
MKREKEKGWKMWKKKITKLKIKLKWEVKRIKCKQREETQARGFGSTRYRDCFDKKIYHFGKKVGILLF